MAVLVLVVHTRGLLALLVVIESGTEIEIGIVIVIMTEIVTETVVEPGLPVGTTKTGTIKTETETVDATAAIVAIATESGIETGTERKVVGKRRVGMIGANCLLLHPIETVTETGTEAVTEIETESEIAIAVMRGSQASTLAGAYQRCQRAAEGVRI